MICEDIKNNLGFEVKNMLWFSNLTERKDWMDLFCSDKYTECPYYRAIYKKYEEERRGNCK